jgi:hypothetical protein
MPTRLAVQAAPACPLPPRLRGSETLFLCPPSAGESGAAASLVTESPPGAPLLQPLPHRTVAHALVTLHCACAAALPPQRMSPADGLPHCHATPCHATAHAALRRWSPSRAPEPMRARQRTDEASRSRPVGSAHCSHARATPPPSICISTAAASRTATSTRRRPESRGWWHRRCLSPRQSARPHRSRQVRRAAVRPQSQACGSGASRTSSPRSSPRAGACAHSQANTFARAQTHKHAYAHTRTHTRTHAHTYLHRVQMVAYDGCVHTVCVRRGRRLAEAARRSPRVESALFGSLRAARR